MKVWALFHGEAYDVLRTGYDVAYLQAIYERIEVDVGAGEKGNKGVVDTLVYNIVLVYLAAQRTVPI